MADFPFGGTILPVAQLPGALIAALFLTGTVTSTATLPGLSQKFLIGKITVQALLLGDVGPKSEVFLLPEVLSEFESSEREVIVDVGTEILK